MARPTERNQIMRTSLTHPLMIDSFRLAEGKVGMTLCPGRKGPSLSGSHWDRDLQADILRLKLWRTDIVISLTPQDEMDHLDVGNMKTAMEGAGLLWLHLPIPDTGIPDTGWTQHWRRISPTLHQRLEAGGRIVIHCRAGLERTALVAALLQCERGESIGHALKRISKARKGAGPLPRQKAWLEEQRQESDRNHRLFRACLFGGAIGDALGAEMEFWSLDRIRQTFPRGVDRFLPHDGRPAAITDDTQMTLFTAEGLIRSDVRGSLKGVCHPPGVVHHALLRWLTTQGETPQIHDWTGLASDPRMHRRRAPGTTCLSSLKAAKHLGDVANNNSKGCGAIMRVAPVALYGGVHCDALADDCSHLTHAHPTGRNAARAQAHVLAQLLDGTLLEDAVRSLQTLRLDDATQAAVERAWTAIPDGRPETVETLGQGWVAEETLSIALYAARIATGFEEGLRIAVTHSGDSDSTAAITGNLLGLMFPDEVMAHPWRTQIECADLIDRLAGDLCDARHHNTGERFALSMWEFYPGG
ncbi:ADP-ribosylglycohydrolase [Gluconobacter frateurii NBRC 101659]|nr:ADP-ribosylglycohydrolase [Gluconobacter frateurii NBRC 101659]